MKTNLDYIFYILLTLENLKQKHYKFSFGCVVISGSDSSVYSIDEHYIFQHEV